MSAKLMFAIYSFHKSEQKNQIYKLKTGLVHHFLSHYFFYLFCLSHAGIVLLFLENGLLNEISTFYILQIFQLNPSIEIEMQRQGCMHVRSRDKDYVALDAQGCAPISKGLYEEVIRKNNQIIRNLLLKLNDVFLKQQEYDSTFKNINEKLSKVSQMNQNMQFQFRSTFLQSSRQQSQLANDMAIVKSTLKIPSIGTPHQAYLSSDFFKERANNINQRVREHTVRGGLRHRTNQDFGLNKEGNVQKQPTFSKIQNAIALVKHGKNRSELPLSQSEEQYSKNTESCIRISEDYHLASSKGASLDIMSKLEQLQQRVNHFISQSDLTSSISLLRQQLQSIIQESLSNRKSECDWNHIDFDQIQTYIDTKIEESLRQKVGRQYFEASLVNLKQAWEQEERMLYQAIGMKADQTQIASIKEKLSELMLKIDHFSFQATLKPSTICLNASINPFIINKHSHHRISARDIAPHGTQSADNTLLARKQWKQEDNRRKQKANLTYTNSLSMLSRSTDKKQTRTMCFYDDLSSSQGTMKQKIWREKVNQALGEQKIKKKTKIII